MFVPDSALNSTEKSELNSIDRSALNSTNQEGPIDSLPNSTYEVVNDGIKFKIYNKIMKMLILDRIFS